MTADSQTPQTFVIRPAQMSDAAAMLAIYRPFVMQTTISFEEVVPSLEEFSTRLQKYLSAWRVFVAEAGGNVIGYAYGSTHRERAAYRWSVETTVYVARQNQQCGVGRSLYSMLLPALADVGYCNAYAGIALPNEASVGLHLASGFQRIGTFPRVGRKHGEWRDVAWFHKILREEPA